MLPNPFQTLFSSSRAATCRLPRVRYGSVYMLHPLAPLQKISFRRLCLQFVTSPLYVSHLVPSCLLPFRVHVSLLPQEEIIMAVVHHLEPLTLEMDSRHTDVQGTYSIGNDAHGHRCLQIDTSGSKTRQIPGKKSQSIRFAPQAIEELKTLLKQHF
jgi:hypothetical protein